LSKLFIHINDMNDTLVNGVIVDLD